MDIWSSVNWDELFGYTLHDCSCMALAASALLIALAVYGRWMLRKG